MSRRLDFSASDDTHTDTYRSGVIRMSSPGKTRIQPVVTADEEAAALAQAATAATPAYHSGIICSGSPGRTRVVPPSDVREEAQRSGTAHESGTIKAGTLGYTHVIPSPAKRREAERAPPPIPNAAHPIRACGDGNTTACPNFDRSRGWDPAAGAPLPAGAAPAPTPAPSACDTYHTGVIRATAQGYTRVVPSPCKHAQHAAAAAAPKPRYISSPIRSSKAGSTNAGSLREQMLYSHTKGPLHAQGGQAYDEIMVAPEGALKHGVLRYAQDSVDRGSVAIFKESATAQTAAATAPQPPQRHTGVIRGTFDGYTSASL